MSHPSGRVLATHLRPALRRFTVLLILMLTAGAVFVAPAFAAGSISGTVYDHDGWTIDAVHIDLWMSPDGAQPYVWAGMTDSDATGAYTVTTPGFGSYRLSFSDPYLRFLAEWWSNKQTLDEANDVWVADDEHRTGINAILAHAGRASGVVTAGGVPVEGIRVDGFRWSDQSQSWEGTSESYTNASGAWSTWALPPGEYRFHFRDTRAVPEYADRFWDGQTFWDNAHQVSIWGGRHVDFINADLETGAFIGGVVQDEWGAPIAGAVVTAHGHNVNNDGWPGVRSATTDALGQYTLGPLAPGDYKLWIDGGPAWLPEWWDDRRYDWEADVTSLGPGDPVVRNVTLAAAGTVSGHVTADGSGDPLEGMAISLYRWNGWDWWGVEGGWWFTDGNGFYSVGGLEPGTYRVQFSDPNGQWAGEFFDNVPGWTGPNEVTVLGGIPTVIDASLARAGHIAGYVHDDSMNPLQGIDVAAWLRCGEGEGTFWDWVGGAQTDWSGYFDIGGLPAGVLQLELTDPNGQYAVEVYEDGLNFGQGYDLVVESELTTWAYPVLQRGGRLYGQVVGDGGQPLDSVQVTFHAWLHTGPEPGDGRWEWYTECWTDQNGDFSMPGLQARPTLVNFWDASGQHLSEYYNDAPSEDQATPVDVPGAGSRNLGVIALAPAGHIAGTVTAAGEGEPLAGIEVTVARWRDDWGDWDHFAGGQTDGNGHYDIGDLAAGAYRVRFWDGNGAYAGEWFENAPDAWSGQDVLVAEGGTTQVDAVLEEACVIEGHVTDGSANPLSGIEAILYYREAPGAWAQYQLDNEERMFTDGDGYYRFAGLPARTYQLRLENSDNPSPWAAEVFDGALVVGTGTDLDLTPGETRVVDPELDLGGGLAGRLLEDEPPFTPLSFAFPMEIGVWTWVPDASPEGGSWQWYAGYATGEDTNGYMHGVDLAPGEYRIDINCWVGAYVPEWYDDAPDLEHATPVTITAGAITDLGIIYMTRSAMIFGTVTGPDGQPVAGVDVRKWTLVDGEWEPGYSFESWSDGYYQLGEMAGGTYRVEFDGRGVGLSREFWDGAASVLGADSIALDPREEIYGIDAQLEAPGAIAGHVRDAGGDPITDVDVMLAVWDDIAGRYVDLDDMQSVARVDDQGAWRLDGLRPGTYKVFSSPSAPAYGDGVVEGVVVRSGETTEVDIVPPLAGSIAGRVTAIGGSPVQDASVSLFIWDPYGLEWQQLAMPADTLSDGTYSMPLVTPGTYRLAFGAPHEGSGFAGEFWDNRSIVEAADDVVVTEGEDVTGIDAVLGVEGDTQPPTAPLVTGADDAWHAEPVELDFSATDDLSGVEEYEYTVDGGAWQHGDHATIGAPADHANDGAHTVVVRAVDFAGHPGPTTEVQVKIDTAGPVVSDDDPGDWLLRSVEVHLTAIDAGCGVVDHIEYAPASDGPWQVGTSFVVSTWKRGGGSGERTTWVRAIDGLGNASDPEAVVVRLDSKPPATTHDSDGLPHAEDVTVHLTATDAHSGPGITFFSVDGGMWMAGDTLLVPALPGGWNDGIHDVRFYSVDAVGNVEQSIKSCTVTIDTLGLL